MLEGKQEGANFYESETDKANLFVFLSPLTES